MPQDKHVTTFTSAQDFFPSRLLFSFFVELDCPSINFDEQPLQMVRFNSDEMRILVFLTMDVVCEDSSRARALLMASSGLEQALLVFAAAF